MKKTALISLLLAGGLFAGCSGDSDKADRDKEPAAIETVFTDLSSKDSVDPASRLTDEDREDLYLEVIRDSPAAPYISRDTDKELLEAGYAACEVLDMGMTPQDIFELGEANGISPYVSGAITGTAIAAFCPEYKDVANR